MSSPKEHPMLAKMRQQIIEAQAAQIRELQDKLKRLKREARAVGRRAAGAESGLWWVTQDLELLARWAGVNVELLRHIEARPSSSHSWGQALRMRIAYHLGIHPSQNTTPAKGDQGERVQGDNKSDQQAHRQEEAASQGENSP